VDSQQNDQPTVSVFAVRQCVELLKARNVCSDKVKKAAGLPDLLEDDTARVPIRDYYALLRAAAAELDDPCFGITLALANRDPRSFDLLGYLLMYSKTLGDAFERAARYIAVWDEDVSVLVELGVPAMRYEFGSPPAEAWVGIQKALASTVLLGRVVTNGEWSPARVDFTQAKPARAAEVSEALSCEVHFGQAFNRVYLSDGDLDLAIGQGDPTLVRHLTDHAERLVGGAPRDSLTERVRRCLIEHMGDEDELLPVVARELAMSTRTLQRRLGEADTSVSRILDETREQLALDMLEREGLDATEVAFRLGFSSPSAFHRAFKRWTGKRPGEVRRRPGS
jgi:AraC-like DNA-binding protein